MILSPFFDPFGRAVLFRGLAVALTTALASHYGLPVALGVGFVGACIASVSMVRRVGPIRRTIGELVSMEASSAAAPISLAALSARVEVARQHMADARRRVEHERDDALDVLEAATAGVFVVGLHDKVEFINDAARRLLDWTAEPLGRALDEALSEEAIIDMAARLLSDEATASDRLAVHVDGEVRTLAVSGAVVREDRTPRRAVIVLHDLAGLTEPVEVPAADAADDITREITREIRPPIASILGDAITLRGEPELRMPQRDLVDRILSSSHRLDAIHRNLTELIRLESAIAPEIESADAKVLIIEATSGFIDAARNASVSLGVDVDSLPQALAIDSELVCQALSSLLDNAIRHTPSGGSVHVDARVISEEGPGELRVTVTDTGEGIPAADHSRIFERFYRVERSGSTARDGTGLGLAIVKESTELHGGRVEVESSEAGSTFTLYFPLSGSQSLATAAD